MNLTWTTWGDPAKVLVNEWAKLRYGIFDEFGFAGDQVYPNFFRVNGNIVPTGTSDAPVAGSWRNPDGLEGCDPTTPGSQSCFFQPSSNANLGLTCSLGYLPFLPSVKRFCNAEEARRGAHDAMPPTKHNVLCSGRSALDVIYSSRDFSRLAVRPGASTPKLEPTMNVVRQPKIKYILVMESSSSMSRNELWKWVSKAARKLIRYDLSDQSQMALVTFSNESTVAQAMTVLGDDRARRQLADRIPDKYKVGLSSDERCVVCGVQTAMHDVLGANKAGGHIIIVTRGDNRTLSLTDENRILGYARKHNVKFSSILLPQLGQALSFFDTVAAASGGRSFVYRAKSKADVGAHLYSNLIEAFQEIRSVDTDYAADIPVRVHTRVAKRGDGEALKTKGEFSIDTTLGRDSRFGILVNDADDYFIKSVSFYDKKGELYGPYSSLSSDFNVINLKTINFPRDNLARSLPLDDVSCDIKLFSFLSDLTIRSWDFWPCPRTPGHSNLLVKYV
jgi:hypothetical protein